MVLNFLILSAYLHSHFISIFNSAQRGTTHLNPHTKLETGIDTLITISPKIEHVHCTEALTHFASDFSWFFWKHPDPSPHLRRYYNATEHIYVWKSSHGIKWHAAIKNKENLYLMSKSTLFFAGRIQSAFVGVESLECHVAVLAARGWWFRVVRKGCQFSSGHHLMGSGVAEGAGSSGTLVVCQLSVACLL